MLSLHAIIPAAGLGRRLGESAGGAPKSLLPVAGRPILCHAVDALGAVGVPRLTVVVGYESSRIRDALGTRRAGVDIDYAVNADYATTEHGFSLYCARAAWESTRAPVLFMDADNVFEPQLLSVLLGAPAPDRVMVDPRIDSSMHDEELVLGRAGRVLGFVRGRAHQFDNCVGGFVGMNRFSPQYMQRLFAFMEQLFLREGRGFKYERVFHRLLAEGGDPPAYLDTGEARWVNVNRPEDVARARAVLAGTAASHQAAAEAGAAASSGPSTAGSSSA